MSIESKDLLQANATIIAGILILLTLTSIGQGYPIGTNSTDTKSPDSSGVGTVLDWIYAISARMLIVVSLIPFAISMFYILLQAEISERTYLQKAKRATFLGSMYLVFAVVFIILLLPLNVR